MKSTNNPEAIVHPPHELNIESEDPWNRLIINLDHIKSNYLSLKTHLPRKSILYTVVKSDAYGHGLEKVAAVLWDAGCRHFAVESPEEGIKLRNEKIGGEILLLNPIPEWMSELCLRYDLSISVIHTSILDPMEEVACKINKIASIHLNLNTGLNRLGIPPSKLLKTAREAAQKAHIRLTGLFAQPQGPGNAAKEYNVLKECYQKLLAHKIEPKYLHFANSTIYLSHPETIADGARIGILLYGILPPEQFGKKGNNLSLKPAMSLHSKLVQIRQLKKGCSIGYRSRQKTSRDTTIGTIPIGYAQGITRRSVDRGYVLIHGEKAPYIGNISMNASTVDLTDIPGAKIGDDVTILGKDKKRKIDINVLASYSGTIAAELMILFGRGISRIYHSKNQEFSTTTRITQSPSPDIIIYYCKTVTDLPNWLDFSDIILFIEDHMVPFNDPTETIVSALDYAFSSHSHGGGFALLAVLDKTLVGAAICVRMDKVEFVPANLLTYLCVHSKHRRKGLGTKLLKQVIEKTEGNIKTHMHASNPALKLFQKMGFDIRYLEMRLEKRRKK